MIDTNNRDNLIEIFQDTEKWCKENKTLASAIQRSRAQTKVYPAGSAPEFSTSADETKTEITVTDNRTFAAAMGLVQENPGKKVVVHNFASATKPGGGVTNGSNAQEECLCRCSTLYPVLNSKQLWDSFYQFHRNRRDARYTDTCIYSPGILIIKSDTNAPQRLPEEKWCQVDVITCAAPNLRPRPNNAMNPGNDAAVRVTDKELLELHKKRAWHMFCAAAANGADILVLGAFGCGVFQNNPEVVARAYKETIAEFPVKFEKIEFAVYCTPSDTRNFEVFRRVLR